jgi:hypothetical protein
MIELFKAGTSHVVNGVTCEKKVVNEYGFEHYLDKGWCFDPKDCYPETKKVSGEKVADSKVTASVTSAPDKAPDVEKLNKTTTKTATKK